MISGKKNVKSGLLGQFLKEAQKGKVAPGTFLVVETWSRLSRGDMADCMKLMLDVFNAGLRVSFCDGDVKFSDRLMKRAALSSRSSVQRKGHTVNGLRSEIALWALVNGAEIRLLQTQAGSSPRSSATSGSSPEASAQRSLVTRVGLMSLPTVTGSIWRRRSLGCNVRSSSP